MVAAGTVPRQLAPLGKGECYRLRHILRPEHAPGGVHAVCLDVDWARDRARNRQGCPAGRRPRRARA